MEKVILAFSGGLDTTYCMPYLQEKGYEVITVTVNTGGFTTEQLEKISTWSKKLGSIEHIEIDAQADLYDEFVAAIIKGNYLRGGTYPACVGPERIVAAKRIAELANQRGIKKIVHGSTGAGNDQVRFDLALRAMITNVEVIVPIRDESLTREQEMEYLKAKGIEMNMSAKDYSINVGVLGTTIGGKETKTPLGLPPDEVYPFVKPIVDTPNEAEELKIAFEHGMPIALNGEEMHGLEIIKAIKSLAEKHGIGKDSHLGTTILGIKGRIVFEAGALKILIAAHRELEKSVLTSKQIFWKDHLSNVWGDLVHEGLYFDPVVKDIEAMINSCEKNVSGEVRIKLLKGNIIVEGSESPHSLLDSSLGIYGEENMAWNGRDAEGFCKIYGLEGLIAYKKNNL